MKIRKQEGFTPTEKLLSRLCENTFLDLFSYLNPVREDGKELCDLIAVFDDHVFIFFDRESRKFDNAEKDISVRWNRWKKEVIEKQIKALSGAEKYIRTGKPIFLGPKRETKLPVKVTKDATVHKFIVAHGASEACEASSETNVYGSLGISYSKPGVPSIDHPFFVELENSDPVHVLDSVNIGLVLGELDTFFDFTAYVTEKEDAIRKYYCLTYCGEEDLLAHYFLNYDAEGRKYRIGEDPQKYQGIIIEEGEWKNFAASEDYRKRKEANKDSYFWDRLLQRTYQNALNGTLIGDIDLGKERNPLNEMAKEPRLMRRVLSGGMLEAIEKFSGTGDIPMHLSFISSFYPDKGYVFLQIKAPSPRGEGYREFRRQLLLIACGAARNRVSHLNTVVGIAMDPPKFTPSGEISEDFALLDCSCWTEKDRTFWERENQHAKFFKTSAMRETGLHAEDFPGRR